METSHFIPILHIYLLLFGYSLLQTADSSYTLLNPTSKNYPSTTACSLTSSLYLVFIDSLCPSVAPGASVPPDILIFWVLPLQYVGFSISVWLCPTLCWLSSGSYPFTGFKPHHPALPEPSRKLNLTPESALLAHSGCHIWPPWFSGDLPQLQTLLLPSLDPREC